MVKLKNNLFSQGFVSDPHQYEKPIHLNLTNLSSCRANTKIYEGFEHDDVSLKKSHNLTA